MLAIRSVFYVPRQKEAVKLSNPLKRLDFKNTKHRTPNHAIRTSRNQLTKCYAPSPVVKECPYL